MTENGIVWEEPPPEVHPSNRGIWMQRLTPLTERPNRWARVRELSKNSAGRTLIDLRNRSLHYPPGRWEFARRPLANGQAAIYARYLGPEDGA